MKKEKSGYNSENVGRIYTEWEHGSKVLKKS